MQSFTPPNNVLLSEFVWFNYATNNSPAVFGINDQGMFQFGANGDVPITGDFDGDGRSDFTVFRPSNGVWYSLKTSEGFSAFPFGISSDQPVPGDYDGDGRHDIAVFRAGFWYINQSRDGLRSVQWGLPGDVPVTVRY